MHNLFQCWKLLKSCDEVEYVLAIDLVCVSSIEWQKGRVRLTYVQMTTARSSGISQYKLMDGVDDLRQRHWLTPRVKWLHLGHAQPAPDPSRLRNCRVSSFDARGKVPARSSVA
jgi:hypothetical protein